MLRCLGRSGVHSGDRPPSKSLHPWLQSMTMCQGLHQPDFLHVAGEAPVSDGAAGLPDAAVDSATQAASSITDAVRDSSAAVQEAAGSTSDSGTSALSGLCSVISGVMTKHHAIPLSSSP